MTENSTTERDLGRVEGKLDLVIQLLGTRDANHDKLVVRVSALERRVLLAIVGGGTALLAYFGDAKSALISIVHAVL